MRLPHVEWNNKPSQPPASPDDMEIYAPVGPVRFFGCWSHSLWCLGVPNEQWESVRPSRLSWVKGEARTGRAHSPLRGVADSAVMTNEAFSVVIHVDHVFTVVILVDQVGFSGQPQRVDRVGRRGGLLLVGRRASHGDGGQISG